MSNKPASELRVGDVIEVNGAMRSVLRVVGGEGHRTMIDVALPDGTVKSFTRDPGDEVEVFPITGQTFPQGDELEDLTYPGEPLEFEPEAPRGSMVMQTWQITGGELYFSVTTTGELTGEDHAQIALVMKQLGALANRLNPALEATDG